MRDCTIVDDVMDVFVVIAKGAQQLPDCIWVCFAS